MNLSVRPNESTFSQIVACVAGSPHTYTSVPHAGPLPRRASYAGQSNLGTLYFEVKTKFQNRRSENGIMV